MHQRHHHKPVHRATTTGYGLNGSPAGSPGLDAGSLYPARSSRSNSTTLLNAAQEGLNSFTEGQFGRETDSVRKALDLVASAATNTVTVTGGGNYSSFFVRVHFSARPTSGDCIIVAERAVRTENGTPVFTTIGTDVATGCTITFATSASNIIKITLTAAADVYGTVQIETYGAGRRIRQTRATHKSPCSNVISDTLSTDENTWN